MAGIQAHADPRLVLYLRDDVCQVLKSIAEIAALAGSVFEDGADPFGSVQTVVDGCCDRSQAFLFIHLLEVAARMKIEITEAKLFTSMHLIKKCLPGLRQSLLVRVAEINQVAIVGKNLPGAETEFRTVFLEPVDIIAGQGGCLPTTLILDKEPEGARFQFIGIDGGILHATCSTHVRTDILGYGMRGGIQSAALTCAPIYLVVESGALFNGVSTFHDWATL